MVSRHVTSWSPREAAKCHTLVIWLILAVLGGLWVTDALRVDDDDEAADGSAEDSLAQRHNQSAFQGQTASNAGVGSSVGSAFSAPLRRLAAPLASLPVPHLPGMMSASSWKPHLPSNVMVSASRMAEGSWMQGVHFALAGLRRNLGYFAPPHVAASTAVPSPQSRNGTEGSLAIAVPSNLSDDLFQVSDGDADGEDKEIVSDMQAMEWAMWPAWAIGGALLCTSICSLCTSATPHLQSVVLAIRFLMNLASSAFVISMLSWSARHNRSDSEQDLALVAIFAFFVEWLILATGFHRYIYWWRSVPDREAKPAGDIMYTFRPRSVYLNGLRPTAEPFAYFAIQSLLMWLYVAGVHKKAREIGVDATSGDAVATRVFFWWLLSAGVQLHMTEQMGSGFVDNLPVWSKLWRAARDRQSLRAIGAHHGVDSAKIHWPPSQELSQDAKVLGVDDVLLRMSMDFIVNLVYYNLMYMSVPVLLVASKQPLELVMNAFAVTYILTLDNEKDQPCISILGNDAASSNNSRKTPALPKDDLFEDGLPPCACSPPLLPSNL